MFLTPLPRLHPPTARSPPRSPHAPTPAPPAYSDGATEVVRDPPSKSRPGEPLGGRAAPAGVRPAEEGRAECGSPPRPPPRFGKRSIRCPWGCLSSDVGRVRANSSRAVLLLGLLPPGLDECRSRAMKPHPDRGRRSFHESRDL